LLKRKASEKLSERRERKKIEKGENDDYMPDFLKENNIKRG
jgi:hypothetical protein